MLTFDPVKVKSTTNRATTESLKSNAQYSAQSSVLSQGNRISQNTVTFDTDDLEIGTIDMDNCGPKKRSIDELIRRVSF